MGLILRGDKESKLTIEEMDGNLTYLDKKTDIYREVIVFTPETENTYASYTGTPDGCATEVVMTAVTIGSGGNRIGLKGDGEGTITQQIASWNLGNPRARALAATSGDFSQIIENGSKVGLTGGTSIGDLPSTYNIEHNLGGIMWRTTLVFEKDGTNNIEYFTNKQSNLIFADNTGVLTISYIDANNITLNLVIGMFLAVPYYVLVEKLY